MPRESSAVYEPTVVVIDDGRSLSRTTKVNKACAKWGAPALALCGIAVGIIALTLVAVGATRNADSTDGMLDPGALSRTSAANASVQVQARGFSDQEPSSGGAYAAVPPEGTEKNVNF